jgi:hypothetical protein
MVRGRAPYNWIWIFQKIVKFRGALNRDSSLGRPNARLGKTNKMILLGAVEQTAKWFSNGPDVYPAGHNQRPRMCCNATGSSTISPSTPIASRMRITSGFSIMPNQTNTWRPRS